MENKKRKTPALVKIGFLTLFTIVVWVVFEVVKIFMTKPPVAVPAEILAPIDPTLDETKLNQIKDRLFLDDTQLKVTTTPSPTSTPTASTEGSLP